MAPKAANKKGPSKTKTTKNGKKFAGISKKKRLGRPPKANKDAPSTPRKPRRRNPSGAVSTAAATLSWASALSEVNSVTGMITKVMANPDDNIAGLSEDKLGIIKGACNIMNAVVQVGTKTLKELQQSQDPEPDSDFDAIENGLLVNQDGEAKVVGDDDQVMEEIGT